VIDFLEDVHSVTTAFISPAYVSSAKPVPRSNHHLILWIFSHLLSSLSLAILQRLFKPNQKLQTSHHGFLHKWRSGHHESFLRDDLTSECRPDCDRVSWHKTDQLMSPLPRRFSWIFVVSSPHSLSSSSIIPSGQGPNAAEGEA
jgi:hypothetical protein